MGAANKHWNGKVLYQIYPRSFKDSNDDGIGDINGISKKLEYLAGKAGSLGVDIIWISPFYPSPMADFGYDIKNYKDIDKIFGNINDFKKLLNKAHSLGLKVLIDFVPNHTSSEHPWFKESRSSLDNPKRNWYVWKKPKEVGSPPNNWQSVFGGSAWQLDKKTSQYYLHSFHKKQPDLNWASQQLVREMQKILRFWLNLGVDGFRVDAISWISKDAKARNDKSNELGNEAINTYDSLLHDKSMHFDQLFKRIGIINQTVKEYQDRFVIYEYYAKTGDVSAYKNFYSNTDSEICAPFNFSLIYEPWNRYSVKRSIDTFFSNIHTEEIAIFCIGNHDNSRVVSRLGERSAKQAAVLSLTLPGMPTIYYGDELGMHDEYIADENIQDPFEKLQPNKNLGRDPARTPMHWNKQSLNGFSEHKSWLKSFESYPNQAYSIELKDSKSFFNLYRRLIHNRKTHEALKLGTYEQIELSDHVYGYFRIYKDEKILVLHNFGPATTLYLKNIVGRIILSTHSLSSKPIIRRVNLKKNESIIVKLKATAS